MAALAGTVRDIVTEFPDIEVTDTGIELAKETNVITGEVLDLSDSEKVRDPT